MALIIFRRHLKKCPQQDRYFRRCACPIHVEGTLGTEEVRQGLNLTSGRRRRTSSPNGTEQARSRTAAVMRSMRGARNFSPATSPVLTRWLQLHAAVRAKLWKLR